MWSQNDLISRLVPGSLGRQRVLRDPDWFFGGLILKSEPLAIGHHNPFHSFCHPLLPVCLSFPSWSFFRLRSLPVLHVSLHFLVSLYGLHCSTATRTWWSVARMVLPLWRRRRLLQPLEMQSGSETSSWRSCRSETVWSTTCSHDFHTIFTVFPRLESEDPHETSGIGWGPKETWTAWMWWLRCCGNGAWLALDLKGWLRGQGLRGPGSSGGRLEERWDLCIEELEQGLCGRHLSSTASCRISGVHIWMHHECSMYIHVLVLHQSRSSRTVLNYPELSTSRIYSLNFPDREQVKSGMQSSVISEKNVQLMCDSPFVVKLYAPRFQDVARVKMLLCVKEQEQKRFVGVSVCSPSLPGDLQFGPTSPSSTGAGSWRWTLCHIQQEEPLGTGLNGLSGFHLCKIYQRFKGPEWLMLMDPYRCFGEAKKSFFKHF